MLQQNSNKGDEVLIPEYTSSDLGAFITAEKKFGDLHAAGGIRYDSRKINSKLFQQEGVVKFDTFNRTVQDFSASLGASYKLNSNSVLKLNLARGFRAPNIAELATNGVHEGTFRYEYGNRYLNPENSLQLDAGYSYNSSHLSFETSLFLSNINHYIFIEKLVSVQGNDSIPDVQNPIPAYKYTQGNAQLMGGEVNVDIHPHPLDWLHIENSFAVVYGSLLNVPDSMKYLPLIPAPKWQSELRAQFARKNKSLQNVYAKLEYVRVFRQDRIFAAYGTESATNGYGLVAVGIGCEVMNSRSNTVLLLHLSLNNVMNIAYQDHLSRLKYAPENQASGRIGVFNPGRNLTCKLIVPF
jgi:iron complex outermembrane receptor protein